MARTTKAGSKATVKNATPTRKKAEVTKVAPAVTPKVKAQPKVQKLPVWKYVGGGNLRLRNGMTVTYEDVFEAEFSAIPTAFRDLMVLLEGDESEADQPKYEEADMKDLEVVKNEDGTYNVMAGTNALNKDPLSLTQAKAFLQTLGSPVEDYEFEEEDLLTLDKA